LPTCKSAPPRPRAIDDTAPKSRAIHGHDQNRPWRYRRRQHRILATEVGGVLGAGKTEHGIDLLVDMTPIDIGRHPEFMAEVSRQSGVHVVACAGFFPQDGAMGIPYYWRRQTAEYIAEMLIADIRDGMMHDGALTPYRAGILKAATGGLKPNAFPVNDNGRHIGDVEEKVLKAIAIAQRETGVAVNTHTQPADYAFFNPGIELLDALEEGGVDPARVIIGHAFVHPDIDQLKEICARGASLQIDHIGIPWQNDSAEALDEMIAVAVCQLADLGYLDRLLFSYDRFFKYLRGPLEPDNLTNEEVPLGYLFEVFAERLRGKGFGDAELHQVLIANPRHLLSF